MFGKNKIVVASYFQPHTINEVTLKAVDIVDLEEGGQALNLLFEDADGIMGRQSFRPLADDAIERKEGNYGLEPSALEQFDGLVGQFMKAIAPDAYDKYLRGELDISAETFEEYIAILAEIFKEGLVEKDGKKDTYWIKFGDKGYISNYPFALSKQNELVMKTIVISRKVSDVQFTNSELKKKNKAVNAAASAPSSFLGGDEAPASDIPF